MKTVSSQNNFLIYILFLIAFFILFFVTKNIYANLQVSLDDVEVKSASQSQLSERLNTLNQLEKDISDENSEIIRKISPYVSNVTEQGILDYFYGYSESQNDANDVIVYRSIQISEPSLNDLGFQEIKIDISAIFAGENTLFSFLNSVVNSESEYKFFIQEFSYPMNEGSGNIQATIPLVIYFN